MPIYKVTVYRTVGEFAYLDVQADSPSKAWESVKANEALPWEDSDCDLEADIKSPNGKVKTFNQ